MNAPDRFFLPDVQAGAADPNLVAGPARDKRLAA